MIARPQDLLLVVRRFAYPLPAHRGWAALYALVRIHGTLQLRWDGLAPRSRIPPEYRAP